MNIFLRTILLATVACITACETEVQNEKPAKKETVFDSQINALNKAKNVDKIIQERDEEQRKKLDQQP